MKKFENLWESCKVFQETKILSAIEKVQQDLQGKLYFQKKIAIEKHGKNSSYFLSFIKKCFKKQFLYHYWDP
jgi:hypothetical protein